MRYRIVLETETLEALQELTDIAMTRDDVWLAARHVMKKPPLEIWKFKKDVHD